MCYWVLEKNIDSFRIGVSLKGISNCYVTPNDEFLVTMTGNSYLAIWNTRSRTMVQSYDIKCNFRYHLKALNGTRDSKYIFFQKEKAEVSMWECATQSIVYSFTHQDQIQDISVTSDDKYMYCCGEGTIYKWDLESKDCIKKYVHPERGNYFLWMILSDDDSQMMANGGGASIAKFNLKNEAEEPTTFDIIQDSGWVLMDISPDGKTLIQSS